MAQRVLIELLLFLIPFAVFLVYRAASRDLKIKDRWPLTRLVLIGAGLAIAALIAFPENPLARSAAIVLMFILALMRRILI